MATATRCTVRHTRVYRHPRAGPDIDRVLGRGGTIDDFLQGFPTVTREQVIAFLEEAKTRMLAKAL
jgi:hypothetical protein